MKELAGLYYGPLKIIGPGGSGKLEFNTGETGRKDSPHGFSVKVHKHPEKGDPDANPLNPQMAKLSIEGLFIKSLWGWSTEGTDNLWDEGYHVIHELP